MVLQGMKFLLNTVHEGENLIIPSCLGQGCLNFTLKHQLPVPAEDKVQHQLDHSFDPVEKPYSRFPQADGLVCSVIGSL